MSGPLERFLLIFGTVLDGFKTEIERLLDNYEVESVDAALIPYIDALIGWPTNFDLPELKRREETLNALSIYRLKGGAGALTALVENIADWDTTVHEGWRFVFFSNSSRCLTPTTGVPVGVIGTPDDELKYTPTQDNWHGLNGLLLEIEPIAGVTDEITSITSRKIARLAPTFAASWANLGLLLHPATSEETVAAPTDYALPYTIEAIEVESEVSAPSEVSTATWSGILLLVSNATNRVTNTIGVKVAHANLGYSGAAPPAPYTAGP